MWKKNICKDDAINQIKQKRKCIDINIGFMIQLAKWEELLIYHNNQNLKFYNFEKEGNVSLLNIKEIACINDSDFASGKFTILLIKHNNKFFKIITNPCASSLYDKVNKFVNLLQMYENYPPDCIDLYIDDKKFFELHLEEIIKCSY
jgi:hypothetical protein